MWTNTILLCGLMVGASSPDCPKSPLISAEDRNLQNCTQQENSPTGQRCKTDAGAVFVREPTGWKDTGNKGLLWHDDVTTHVDFEAAKKFCSDKGQRLPTANEFRTAERHGFREPLNRMTFYYYWSSSQAPSQGSAYGFGTNARLLATLPKDSGKDAYYVAARCVSNP